MRAQVDEPLPMHGHLAPNTYTITTLAATVTHVVIACVVPVSGLAGETIRGDVGYFSYSLCRL